MVAHGLARLLDADPGRVEPGLGGVTGPAASRDPLGAAELFKTGTTFTATIHIDTQLQRKAKIPSPLDPGIIHTAAKNYYQKRYIDELNKFYKHTPHILEHLKKAAAHIATHNLTLIRIGRGSQHECITFSPPYTKPPAKTGTTRTLAEIEPGKLTPLGWAAITITPVGAHRT